MANTLDELTGPVNEAGRDVRVIEKQLPVKIGFGSILFEIALWVTIPILTLAYLGIMGTAVPDPLMVGVIGCLGGLLPGLIFGCIRFQHAANRRSTGHRSQHNFF